MVEEGKMADARGNGERDPRIPKQAVVIVHGIGEQRPLETLRSFVETMYQRDPSLTHDDDTKRVDDPVLGRVNRVWIVPDAATGSIELRRISTPASLRNIRTDFFEFYWADIMDGTPAELVTSWIKGILLRSPFRVPRRTPVWIAWILLWVLAILLAGLSLAILKPDAGPFGAFVNAVTTFVKEWQRPIAIGLAIVGLAWLAVRAIATRPIRNMRFLGPVVLLAAAGAVWFFLDAIGTPRAWAAALSAAIAALMAGVIVPYVGDVARYVRATPSTIAKREAVRERGLKLLRALHEERDWENKRVYDRIVLVGHSLGAIIAYDLLTHLWEERGPSHKRTHIPSAAVIDALGEVDKYVVAAWDRPQGDDSSFPVEDYRIAQKSLFDALVASNQGWLISDFVTLGSPLVHTEFLIADSRDDMARGFKERFLCSAPPRPDEPKHSMLYGRKPIFAHFAAPFAAVRWTNIHDEHWFPLCGDVVSGPVASRERFGPGIREHRVAIRRPGLFPRFLTHTLYWTWRKHYRPDDPPEHIRHLRNALEL